MKTPKYLDWPKEQAVKEICSEDLDSTVTFITSSNNRAWKATWLLNQAIKTENIRLDNYVKKICHAIKDKPSNHKRELLRILETIQLNENNEGLVFDVSISCWEDLRAQSSCRMVGFRLALKIAKKHRELIQEVRALADDRFLTGLSPGIKHSVLLQLESIE